MPYARRVLRSAPSETGRSSLHPPCGSLFRCSTTLNCSTRAGRHKLSIVWFLVQTNSNCEALAESSLSSVHRAFRVFAPKVLVERRHARRRELVSRPFLQRYLFVADDQRGTSLIRSAPGVSHVVKNADGPVMVRDDVVYELKRRQYRHTDGKYYVAVECQGSSAFVLDEPVRVEHAGTVIHGLFKKMTSCDRAQVFLLGLGKMIVDVNRLEKTA